jgi:hypothetical protein
MSLQERMKIKREQKQARDGTPKAAKAIESKRVVYTPDFIASPMEQIRELAIDHDVKLALNPLMVDEESNEYDQRSTIYKVPINEETVKKFDILCKLTAKCNRYITHVKYLTSDPDIPLHFFPLLECSIVRADPSNHMIPMLKSSPLLTTTDTAGTNTATSTTSTGTGMLGPTSGHNVDFTTPYTPPNLLPSPKNRPPTNNIFNESPDDKWLLYLRCASGSRSDLSSWGSLESSLQEGRWVSEKLIVKWSLQLVRSLWTLHSHFCTYGSLYSCDVTLVSDETIISMKGVKDTYILKTEERAMSENLYNQDFKGVYLRSNELLRRLEKERKEMIRQIAAKAAEGGSSSGEDEGDGVGGLSAPTTQLLAPVVIETAQDREDRRKLFVMGNTKERQYMLLTEEKKSKLAAPSKRKKDVVLPPPSSNRKDAWLRIPFVGMQQVEYVSGIKSTATTTGATGVTTAAAAATSAEDSDNSSGQFSLDTYATTGSSLMTKHTDRPQKNNYLGAIGDNKQLQIEHIPKNKTLLVNTNADNKHPSTAKDHSADLLKYVKPPVDEHPKKKKFIFYPKLQKNVPPFVKVAKLTKTIVPGIRYSIIIICLFYLCNYFNCP